MGQAKAREAALRDAMIREIDEISAAASDDERKVAAALALLPVVSVRRADRKRLDMARMKPRECHANAGWQAANDPTKKTRHIVGWWKQGDVYVLHSVIEFDEKLICITPQEPHVADEFEFVTDERITWRAQGSERTYYRDGWELPKFIRTNPEATIAANIRMKERLLAGVKPHEAVRMHDAEEGARLLSERERARVERTRSGL